MFLHFDEKAKKSVKRSFLPEFSFPWNYSYPILFTVKESLCFSRALICEGGTAKDSVRDSCFLIHVRNKISRAVHNYSSSDQIQCSIYFVTLFEQGFRDLFRRFFMCINDIGESINHIERTVDICVRMHEMALICRSKFYQIPEYFCGAYFPLKWRYVHLVGTPAEYSNPSMQCTPKRQ